MGGTVMADADGLYYLSVSGLACDLRPAMQMLLLVGRLHYCT
jgi:hypothetical protein